MMKLMRMRKMKRGEKTSEQDKRHLDFTTRLKTSLQLLCYQIRIFFI